LPKMVSELEKKWIISKLKESDWNQEKAAKLLSITRKCLRIESISIISNPKRIDGQILKLGSKVALKFLMPNHWILLIDPFKNLLNAYRVILEDEKFLVEMALN